LQAMQWPEREQSSLLREKRTKIKRKLGLGPAFYEI